MNHLRLSVAQIHEQFENRSLSAEELCQQSLDAIRKTNDSINAVVRTHEEQALTRAKKLDEEGNLKQKPLGGIPVLIKDNIAIEGVETTAASHILHGYKPPYHATAVQRLLDAGAIIVGQTNMDEFAMGSSNETSHYGPVKNPWGEDRVPGGSSGGSAAAVAAGYSPISIGSDTGGSIRQPAAFCGVVGLKPTYGRVSRSGLFAYGSSLDQIGPLSNHAEDSLRVLQAIEGADPLDSTCIDHPATSDAGSLDLKGFKIGVPVEFFDTSRGLRQEMADLLQASITKLKERGAEIIEVNLPILDHVISTYYLIANSEASSNLARYDSIRFGHRCNTPENLEDAYKRSRAEGFGTEVQTRIMLGTYALSAGYFDAYYKKADKIRLMMREQLHEILEKVDILVSPTSPDVAFKIGEKVDDPLSMYMQDLYTTFVNLVSAPAISVPCGTIDGLPAGIQFIGRAFDESNLIRAAVAVEQDRDFETLR